MKLRFATFAVWGCLAGLSCLEINSEGSGDPLNPNGDSELALLMRAMFEDGMKIKEQIAAGKKPEVTVNFEHILSAEPTEPGMKNFPEFRAFAQHYISAMKTLKHSSPETARPAFENMVDACNNCHQMSCPGPLMKINKLSR